MWSIWVSTFVHGRPEALAPFVRLCCADWLAGRHRGSGYSGPALEVMGYRQCKEGGLEGGPGDVRDGTDEKVEEREIVGCGCGCGCGCDCIGGDTGKHRRGEKGGFHQAAKMLEGSEVREGCAKVCEDLVDGFGGGEKNVTVN